MRPLTIFQLPAAVALVALSACTSMPDPPAAGEAVEAAHTRLIAAYNACDEATFTGAYAENFAFTTSNTRSVYTTRDALRGYLAAGCRNTPSPQVTLKTQSIRMTGPVALIVGQYVFRLVNQGKPTEITQNFTLAMQQEPAGWRIAAHHVSLAP